MIYQGSGYVHAKERHTALMGGLLLQSCPGMHGLISGVESPVDRCGIFKDTYALVVQRQYHCFDDIYDLCAGRGRQTRHQTHSLISSVRRSMIQRLSSPLSNPKHACLSEQYDDFVGQNPVHMTMQSKVLDHLCR